MPEERILDCRGLQCPMPVVKMKRALSEIEQGALTVIVDNEISSQNVTRAAKRAGCTVSTEREGPDLRVRIQKGEAAAEAQPEPASPTAALVTSATLGQGDDTLGGILMKAFLYALSQLPSPPGSLILANSGVRLAIEGSECLDTLRSLAEAGTEIMVCGTCLDYFGLTESLAVGRVSNMYEIVETLIEAPKTISP